jgi:hypothetical protein
MLIAITSLHGESTGVIFVNFVSKRDVSSSVVMFGLNGGSNYNLNSYSIKKIYQKNLSIVNFGPTVDVGTEKDVLFDFLGILQSSAQSSFNVPFQQTFDQILGLWAQIGRQGKSTFQNFVNRLKIVKIINQFNKNLIKFSLSSYFLP